MEWMKERTSEWTNERTNERMNEWLYEWMNELMNIVILYQFHIHKLALRLTYFGK